MQTSEFIRRYTSGGGYELSHVIGEFTELLAELRKGDREAIVEKFDDTVMTAQLWWWCKTGWDWRLRVSKRCIRKYHLRTKVWERIFRAYGLEFHPRYLRGGGNYRRSQKRAAALCAAWKDQQEQ